MANLVLRAPIVSVACARAYMSGADLELALGCSMVIAERGAKFDFDADPVASLGIYASLSRKIGFVRAERLMEEGRLLEADEMKDLLLIKDAADAGEGPRFLEAYLKRNVRRHNSCYSIYRAQRIVSAADVRPQPHWACAPDPSRTVPYATSRRGEGVAKGWGVWRRLIRSGRGTGRLKM
ncbi:MAG: hypothetical protein WDM92_10300 [Caulobacteraceae bacterium]